MGYKLNTYKGSFANLRGEGVSFDVGRQICFEGHRLDLGSKGGGGSAALPPASSPCSGHGAAVTHLAAGHLHPPDPIMAVHL